MRQSDQKRPCGQVLLIGFGGDVMGFGPDEREAMQSAFRTELEIARADPDPEACALATLENLAKSEFVYVVSESALHIEALLRSSGLIGLANAG